MRLLATVTKEDGQFVAQCLDVDVASEGPTVEAALANLQEAVELFLAGNPTAKTLSPIVATIDVKVA